jgi:hypothetical protein
VSFVADTDTHAVCDLCTARARQAGWIPAAEITDERQEASGRQRRNRALFDLLRRLRSSPAALASAARRDAGTDNGSAPLAHARQVGGNLSSERGVGTGGALAAPAPAAGVAADAAARGSASHVPGSAIEIFNHTEQPRRIAGIARSLGAPRMTVRRAGPATPAKTSFADLRALDADEACVAIIAAWELCWYRWEVTLGRDGTSSLELVDRGTRLDELPAEDLAGNAAVDERGSLSLA